MSTPIERLKKLVEAAQWEGTPPDVAGCCEWDDFYRELGEATYADDLLHSIAAPALGEAAALAEAVEAALRPCPQHDPLFAPNLRADCICPIDRTGPVRTTLAAFIAAISTDEVEA